MHDLLTNKRAVIADACRRFGVESLAAFGSIVREDFRPETSDVDFLVRFRATREPGYADRFMDFAETLEKHLGRSVDLLTEHSLRNPYLQRRIDEELIVIYEDGDPQAA